MAQALGLTVDSALPCRIGEGYGLASDVARVVLAGPEAPPSVVVKMWSTESTAGDREVRFYRELAPSLDARIPHCYLADAAGGRGVLVLEDVTPARQGDVLEPIDDAELRAIAVEYARLNRSPVALPEWLPGLRWTGLTSEWFESRRAAFYDRFGTPDDRATAALVERAEAAHRVALARLDGAPHTVLHGDLHLDNVLFAADGPVLLDWAGCARGPGEMDLAALLISMGSPARYEAAIAAYAGASRTEVDRYRLGAAVLVWSIVHTLGIALWQPSSAREERMAPATLARVGDALATWQEVDPDLFAGVL